jgi:hypothetical protein
MTKPDRLYPDLRDDFEARIRVLTPEEGGRKTYAVNGIRWDFRYALDTESKGYFMIYPDFLDAAGNSLPVTVPLPTNEWLSARMYISNQETRERIHQKLLHFGTSFYCCEGPRIVAEGTVTRLTGLFDQRP